MIFRKVSTHLRSSSCNSNSRCLRNISNRKLLSLVLVFLLHVLCGAQTPHPFPSLDVTPKHSNSKLKGILGMRASFVCSSALAPRLSGGQTGFHYRTSLKRPVRTNAIKASAAKNVAVSSRAPLKRFKIACVGDIHGQWDDIDESALRNLKPDLALFVGDYGDENVNITKRIAAFAEKADFGIATMFGNHDAFYTASSNGRRRAPYNKAKICRVTEQMEVLAPYDVSYRSKPFDDIGISVNGGRSFSVGGPNWKYNDFFQKFVGVYSLAHSTSKMVNAVSSSKHKDIVFLSHSGPVGLGDKPSDPCGKDWGNSPGGDFGDTDLRAAIETAREEGFRVPLCVFGHMHKRLMQGQGNRTMLKTEPDGETGYTTVMLNAAVCPRHKIGPKSTSGLRHFQLVQLGQSGYVDEVQEAWVSGSGKVAESTLLFRADSDNEVTLEKEDQVVIEKPYPERRMSIT